LLFLLRALLLVVLVACLARVQERRATAADAATPANPEEAERFFETQVRPMLAARCFSCHGAEKQEGGLRLDSRAAVLKGSDGQPAVVVPGEPDRSPLIHAVRYEGDVQMPPEGKLEDKDQALLVAWVKLGLPWGGVATTPAAETIAERGIRAKATHWAYKKVQKPELPPVTDAAWSAEPLDRFVLAELEKRSLRPSPPAERSALLRRIKFDLVGLPPTAAEVDEFCANNSPDATAQLVDRLLASPEYGQRWGRHWLDVARYSDTKGYVFTEDRRYPYAYTYRDYVIRAFNEDLPYDEFVRQQVAADLLNVSDRRALAAMGFLTVGRRFSNNTHDIIDDRIDVVTRGLMGLTVTCARCHDHKYDPIAHDDYYSLYGVFASSVEPGEPPLLVEPQENEAYNKYMQELAAREKKLTDFRETKLRELTLDLRTRVKDYLCQVIVDTMKESLPDDADFSYNPDELRPPIIKRWKEYIDRVNRQPDPVFAPWQVLAALPREGFAERAAEVIEQLKKGGADAAPPPNQLLPNQRIKDALIAAPPKSMLDVARVYGDVLASVQAEWLAAIAPVAAEAGKEPPKPPTALPDAASEQLRQVLYADGAPTVVSLDDARRVFDRATQNELGKLRKSVDELKVNSPAAPPRAMVLNDAPTPHNPRIFLRGDPARPGKEVPRRFVQFLSNDDGKPFEHGSGRLELAQRISSPDNPLTARVLVNRVWMEHFGAAIVRTPSDFGLRSEAPTHPQLLDYLAAQFVEEGWSIKKLHRHILLSSTYQQSSADRPDCHAVDSENQLLWRANRRRIDFEALRDSLLAAAGRLDTALDGRSIDLWAQPFTTRRSVYAFIDRQDLPGVFRVFDFSSPDVSTPQRPQTTVPQQALFMMNSPFVVEQAKGVAARAEVTAAPDDAAKAQAMYRATLGRDATAEETQLATAFVAALAQESAANTTGANAAAAGADAPKDAAPKDANMLDPWQRCAQALLMTNEFLFVD